MQFPTYLWGYVATPDESRELYQQLGRKERKRLNRITKPLLARKIQFAWPTCSTRGASRSNGAAQPRLEAGARHEQTL
jgi:hypothetical protein